MGLFTWNYAVSAQKGLCWVDAGQHFYVEETEMRNWLLVVAKGHAAINYPPGHVVRKITKRGELRKKTESGATYNARVRGEPGFSQVV